MELWKKLKYTGKPIVLYGMGNGADRILDVMESKGIKAVGVFASDDFVRHQQFRGFTVCSYAELKEKFQDMVVLVAFGTHRPEVMDNIKRIMLEQEVYIPDVPVVGDTIFDEAFLNAHQTEFETVYGMLADERSKLVYYNILKSKFTGELFPLFEAESEYEEVHSILNLTQQESFLDLGAFSGDTVQRFLRDTNGVYNKIIAVEPDVKNFKKLLNNTTDIDRLICINACVDQFFGFRYFEMDGGRKSQSLTSGGKEIRAVTIDEIVGNDEITYIKMDVEGMESAAIKGGKETIKRCAPLLQVAGYHRTEDLFEIPLLVQRISPGAKVYIRHYPCVPAWDTDFYFIYDR